MPIRVLCVTEAADRPTLASFIGMREAGVDLTVACPATHKNNQILLDAGVNTVDIRLPRRFDKRGTAALRAELIRGRYHVLHTFNNKAASNGLRACKGLPVKIVCYRGIVGALSVFNPVSWLRYLNPRIDRIVCVAEAVRAHFLTMQPAFLRMPATRPVTIHKGHKLEWYTDAPASLRALGVPDGAFVVGCTANYRPRKGIEVLVDALAHLPADVHLLLIGRMDAKKLSRRIARSPARERIHRAGFRSDAPAVAAACDVFCLPSTKREGLARAVIEAMAYGVPPVVTDIGGSPELVEDGESGFIVPPADSRALAEAIAKLRGDAALRERMGRAARERIGTHFRSEDTVKKTIALYEELIPSPDAPRTWPAQ